MENVTIIAAIGKSRELGRGNQLIWKFPGDMQFFKKHTLGKVIVMGKNTFLSLPGVLPERKHVVLTRNGDDLPSEVVVYSDLDSLLDFICCYDGEVMVIGGESVYQQMLPFTEKMLLTEIDDSCLDADSYFPEFSFDEFDKTVLDSNVYDGVSYKHLVYQRKRLQK